MNYPEYERPILDDGRSIAQEDSATEAVIARSYHGGVECGDRDLSALNLTRIAAAVHVEVGELFPPVQDFRSHLE